MPISQRPNLEILSQDPVLSYAINHANESNLVRRLILFGSRARGTEKPRSDYDLAVEFKPNTGEIDRQKFLLNLGEGPTLHKVDALEWKPTLDAALRAEIEKEGISLPLLKPS